MDILYISDSEQLWFKAANGLVFSDMHGKKRRLVEETPAFFDVAYVFELNLVYASRSGEIVRLQRRGNGWVKTVILKSRSGEMDIFGIRLVVSEEKLHLVYGLLHNGEHMIVHQILPGGEPTVVNTASSDAFFVRRDETGCIYVICSEESGWEVSVFRGSGWSRPEHLSESGNIKDILVLGYKEYLLLMEENEKMVYKDLKNVFEVSGNEPSIVKYRDSYTVISEDAGGVYYTDSLGRHKIISSDKVKKFLVRFREGQEYSVCESCHGTVTFGVPRLFLLDLGMQTRGYLGETARLELTKRIIELEARVAKLEEKINL